MNLAKQEEIFRILKLQLAAGFTALTLIQQDENYKWMFCHLVALAQTDKVAKPVNFETFRENILSICNTSNSIGYNEGPDAIRQCFRCINEDIVFGGSVKTLLLCSGIITIEEIE